MNTSWPRRCAFTPLISTLSPAAIFTSPCCSTYHFGPRWTTRVPLSVFSLSPIPCPLPPLPEICSTASTCPFTVSAFPGSYILPGPRPAGPLPSSLHQPPQFFHPCQGCANAADATTSAANTNPTPKILFMRFTLLCPCIPDTSCMRSFRYLYDETRAKGKGCMRKQLFQD